MKRPILILAFAWCIIALSSCASRTEVHKESTSLATEDETMALFVARVTIKDPAKFREYAGQAKATFAPYGGEVILRGKVGNQLVSKTDHQAIGVIRFPDAAALEAWYRSREYQAIVPLRDEAADLNIVIYDMAKDKTRKIDKLKIPEALSVPKKSIDVLGSQMTYLEMGEGDPVVFVHGNPTSSYLWRNVLPFAAYGKRAIALDLIGMGGSAKPDIGYSFEDHYQYFSGFLDALGIKQLTLVGHDWGATLAWEYARRNPEKVTRLAFMEGVLPPAFPAPSFEAMGPEMGDMFRRFKDPIQGPRLLLDQNMFIEKILPSFVNRKLGPEAMRAYRAPFLERKFRKPLLAWPRQVPIAGTPASTTQTLNDLEEFMEKTEMPVLLLYAKPGAVVPFEAVSWYVSRIPNLETAFVGNGIHFLQEDVPDAVGLALVDWMRRN